MAFAFVAKTSPKLLSFFLEGYVQGLGIHLSSMTQNSENRKSAQGERYPTLFHAFKKKKKESYNCTHIQPIS